MRLQKNFVALSLSAILLCGTAAPAFALEYNYESDAPGKTFYKPTSTDSDYVAESDTIVVGDDGTISTEVTGNVTQSPLSALDLPVGEYPEAWGTATDIAIAQTSVFPNEIAPTTQMINIHSPIFDPGMIPSGALPVGGYQLTGIVASQTSFGLNTAVFSMPSITKGGAIGHLSIPSIGLSKYIYEGTSQSNMRKGLAHFDCTSGWNGNVAIAGHNRPVSWAAFAKLKDIQTGDIVTYTTAYGSRTYVVSNITSCATSDTSGLLQSGTNKLTMYTCLANNPSMKLCVTATQLGS